MKHVLILIACAAVVFTTSCGRQSGTVTDGKKRVKLALVANAIGDFWYIANAGIKQAEKDFNARCSLRMPSSGTATEQKAIVEYVLAGGVDGIAISPMDPQNQTALLNEIASKTNLICVDSDVPTSKRSCFIGTNNVEAGIQAAKEVMKVLPSGGKIMIFVGNLDATNAIERLEGVHKVLDGSNIKILGVLTDDTDCAKAKANVEDTLTKHPGIAGLLGLWSYNGPACAEAVKAAGKVGKVKIVAFDQEEATLHAISDGIIECTIAQNPFKVGYESVRVLAALARGEDPEIPASKKLDTGITVVSGDNVDSYWADLKQLKAKS